MDKPIPLKEAINKLPAVSDTSVDEFTISLPEILAMVGEKHAILNKYCTDQCLERNLELAKALNAKLGGMLLAVYRFHLYDALIEEFSWFVNVLRHRGFQNAYFGQTLETWVMVIHALIPPKAADDLTRPLNFLTANLTALIDAPPVSEPAANAELKGFIGLLLEKKRRAAAEMIISGVTKDQPPAVRCHRLIIPALDMVGALWQKNKITAADEHAATEICRYIIFRLCDMTPPAKPLGLRALVACVPGEEHELGAALVAAFLDSKGWTVLFIGPNAPAPDILKAAVGGGSDAVFLSVTMVANLISTVDLLRSIKSTAPKTKLVVGGRATRFARDTLEKECDLITDDFDRGHREILGRIGGHA
jgi:methanogenic corrinoid protein MtbC1